MLKSFNFWRVVLSALLFTTLSSEVRAAVHTLDSSVLRVEVSDSPYSFRITEKTTGDVLLVQSSTSFKFGNQLYPAGPGAEVISTPDRIQATLPLQVTGRETLPPNSDKVRISFTFTSPQVVQIVLQSENGTPVAISEEFKDQGEHYYGIWENPYGGDIDNRGARREFLGVQHEPDGNYDSARAPFYVTSKKYGIYVESTAQGHYSIARAGKTTFTFNDAQLKYHVIYGPSYGEIFSRYNAMAGPAIR